MFEQEVLALLEPLVNSRVRWDTLDDGDVLLSDGCHIVLDMVSGRAENYVDGSLPGAHHTRLQIAVWSKRRAITNNMMRLVERTLRLSTAFKAVEVVGGFATLHQEDIDGYGARQQFNIWYTAL